MEKKIFYEPSVPAYFEASGKDFKITPQKNSTTNQIEFLVEGENLDRALIEFYANPTIGILDFLRSLKSFRSCIFTLRGERR